MGQDVKENVFDLSKTENKDKGAEENASFERTESDGVTVNSFDLSKKVEEEAPKGTDEPKETEKPEVDDKETEKPKDDKKSGEPEKKVFKIQAKEEVKKTDEPKKETESVTEESVKKFLQEKLNLNISDFSDLSIKQEIPESVKEFDKFVKETGRGHIAFFNSKKDWAKEDKDVTIKEHFKYLNPNISDEDAQTKLELLKLSEDDKDGMTDREIKAQELEYNETYSKALAYMQGIAKKYGEPLEEVKQQPKQLTQEEITKAYTPYWNRRDTSLENFKEVVLPVEDFGDIKLLVNEDLKSLISQKTQTQESFFSSWMDKDEKGQNVVNTDRSVSDVSWSIPEVRNNFIEQIISQVYTLTVSSMSKENRHVNLDKPKEMGDHVKETVSVEKISDNNTTGFSSKMGEPLIK